MKKPPFKKLGNAAVKEIEKNLVKFGYIGPSGGKKPLTFEVKKNEVILYWEDIAYFKVMGRGPGKRPPFEVIEEFVVNVINPDPKLVWVITNRICEDIATKGTAAYNDKARHLKVSVMISEIVDMIEEELVKEIERDIDKRLKKIWQ